MARLAERTRKRAPRHSNAGREPLVSVIIPCHNVERYIEQCVESATSQTLREIEVICVDDGSADGTAELLDRIAARDSRVRVFHRTNHGYGATMNFGMDQARARYVAFLESDDLIVPDAYQTLFDLAERNGVDIIKGNWYDLKGEPGNETRTERKVCSKAGLYGKILRPVRTPELFYIPMMNVLGLFRTEFLRDERIRHNETPGASHQDIGFWFLTFAHAESVFLVDKPFYCYRLDNPNSSIHDRSKIYCTSAEYNYVRALLEPDASLWQAVESVFWHRFYTSTEFTLLHIDDQFRREFISAMAKDFATLLVGPEPRVSRFSPEDLATITEIVRDPEEYYFTKVDVRAFKTSHAPGDAIEYCCAVSVIVPVYNTDRYLAACLDSILGQDFADIEVLCVDDGSTDDSLLVLLGYERRDARVRVLRIHHGGQSAARNRALQEAQGRYVYFMDSDDLLAEGALSQMYHVATERDLDVFLFDGSSFLDDDIPEGSYPQYVSAYQRVTSYSEVTDGMDLFVRMQVDKTFYVSPCLQFFRHGFLREIEARFREGIIYEDNIFTFECLLRAGRVSHENVQLFQRRIHQGSTITREVTYENFYGYFVCWAVMMGMAVNMRLSPRARTETLKLLNSIRSSAIRFGQQLSPEEIDINLQADSPLLRDLYINVIKSYVTTGGPLRLQAQAEAATQEKIAAQQRQIGSLQREIARVRGSWAFRTGRAITFLPRQAKRAVRRQLDGSGA